MILRLNMNRKLQAELSNYLEITFQSDGEYDLTEDISFM